MFLHRLISSLVLWTLVLVLVYTGNKTGSWLLLVFFGVAAQWEFYLAQQQKGLKVYKQSGVACGLLLYFSTWLCLIHRPEWALHMPVIESFILSFVIIGALVRHVISGEPKPEPVGSIALTLLGFFYVPYLFNYMGRVAFWPGSVNASSFILLYLVVVTKFSDMGAYLTGSMIGKHKMIPRISPGKTWEGFVGGILASLIASIILPVLCRGKLVGLDMQDTIFLGLLLPVASVVGDLAESVVKRDAKIKDSGNTIPGIGGALDLVDSLLFTAPVLYFYLLWAKGLA